MSPNAAVRHEPLAREPTWATGCACALRRVRRAGAGLHGTGPWRAAGACPTWPRARKLGAAHIQYHPAPALVGRAPDRAGAARRHEQTGHGHAGRRNAKPGAWWSREADRRRRPRAPRGRSPPRGWPGWLRTRRPWRKRESELRAAVGARGGHRGPLGPGSVRGRLSAAQSVWAPGLGPRSQPHSG